MRVSRPINATKLPSAAALENRKLIYEIPLLPHAPSFSDSNYRTIAHLKKKHKDTTSLDIETITRCTMATQLPYPLEPMPAGYSSVK
jgi:hypothetical protein